MDSPAGRLMSLLREIVECCQEGEQLQAEAHHLTPAEARALMAFHIHDCRTTADLASALFVGKSRVTRILDGLVKKGLIARSEHHDDRRLCTISLTNEGRQTLTELVAYIFRLHEDVLSSLPPRRTEETLAMLAVLKTAMHATRAKLRDGDFSPIDQAPSAKETAR